MRVGILTGGGDCPGLNAVIRAVVRKGVFHYHDEFVGFLEGWRGLIEDQSMELDLDAVGGILPRGGTILRTSRTNPSKRPDGFDRCIATIQKHKLDALVAIGGDDTLSVAQKLHEKGVKVVGVPKTIDNDLEGTLFTFGFDSAVSCATDALDRLHSTAESHNRVMVLEVMGRYAGWIALYAGVAGGADVILIPEIPFSYESVCSKIQERENLGKKFTILVVAEGAREKDGGFTTSGTHSKTGEARLGGIGAVVSAKIEKCTGKESRVCVLGHLQRGGSPTTFDRALCSIFGATAVELVAAGEFGKMVAFTGPHIGAIKISDAIGKIKVVRPDGNLVRTARALGICFGD